MAVRLNLSFGAWRPRVASARLGSLLFDEAAPAGIETMKSVVWLTIASASRELLCDKQPTHPLPDPPMAHTALRAD